MMRLTLLFGLIVAIIGASLWYPVITVLRHDEPGLALIGQRSDYSLQIDSRYSNQQDSYLFDYIVSNEAGRAYMHVYVVVDEEFVAYSGNDWRKNAYQIIDGANKLTSEAGLGLKLHSLGRWHSDDDVKFISSHVRHIGAQVQSPPRLLILAITGQATTRNDGYFRPQDGIVIAQYDARRPREIYSLIAHEIGHVVGLHHHDAEEECTEEGCIMDAEGHEHSETWCDHHKQEIQRRLALAASAY